MTNDMFEAIYGELPTEGRSTSVAGEPVQPAVADMAAGAVSPTVTEDFVLDALRLVVDPEVGLDIVTLGLVYELSVEDGVVTVVHTLTTPGCPMEGVIGDGIERVLGAIKGVRAVNRRLVFEPSWYPGMIREETW